MKRFHTVPTVHSQSDAEHSFGVAWFIYLLTEGSASSNLIWAALAHDLAEQTTGDLPTMIKRNPGVGPALAKAEFAIRQSAGLEFPLTEEEQKLLDLSDWLEGMMYCISERHLGNLNARFWYYRFVTYIKESGVVQKNRTAMDVFVAVQDLWRTYD